MTSRPIVLLSVLLALVAPPLAAQKARVRKRSLPDSVSLSFSWPVGLEAAVTHRRAQIRVGGGRSDTTALEVRYRMVVEADPRGRRIGYRDFAFPAALDTGAARLAPEAWASIASVFAPPIVVSDSGEVLGLADEEGFVATLRALIQPHLDSLGGDSLGQRARALAERFFTPEVLASQAVADWHALVGFWLGAHLEAGAVMKTTSEEAIPFFPGRTIPYDYLFSFAGRAPCTASALDSACVVLDLVTVPDSAALRTLLASMMQDVLRGTAGASVRYRRLAIENHIRLVTEARGLVPHLLDVRQESSVELEVPGVEVQSVSQVRMRRLEFVYDRPPR